MMPNRLLRFALASAAGVLLTGCLFRASTVSEHRFVLAPLPPVAPAASAAPAQAQDLSLGIGQVKLPAYLLRSSLPLRKGDNEIHYLQDALWAEPLDQGLQRTLAANLSSLLPTQQIYLSAWDPGQVKLRVFVTVEQFDVDTRGRGTLTAWWRITQPGSDKALKSGKANFTHTGPPPHRNPQTIVATLSTLVADLSRQLAQAIRETVPADANR